MSFSDVVLDHIVLRGKKLDAKVRKAVQEAHLERGMGGPSRLTMTLLDSDRELIQSSLFNSRVRANVGGHLFVFDGYMKSQDVLSVSFISGLWADLRERKGPLVAQARTTTRTRFARRMVSEVGYAKFRGEAGSPNLKVLRRGKKESTIRALTRLAGERQWRAFEDDNTIYFGSDDWLAGLGEPLVLSEKDDGINYIDPEYKRGKQATSCTIGCFARRWATRPGAPVKIRGLGDLAGHGLWLIESMSRPLTSQLSTLQLVRKTPDLPEPRPEERAHSDRGGVASGQSGKPGTRSSSGWQWPTEGPLTGRFGDPRSGHSHAGIDIDGETGDPIRASKPGYVTSSYYSTSYGNVVIVDHGGGWTSLYAHLSTRLVASGQKVDYTTLVGRMGNTGNSTGSHLHFEIRRNGSAVDPLPLLP